MGRDYLMKSNLLVGLEDIVGGCQRNSDHLQYVLFLESKGNM